MEAEPRIGRGGGANRIDGEGGEGGVRGPRTGGVWEEGGWGGVLGRDLEVVGDGESQEERRRPKASLDVFAEGKWDGDCVSGWVGAE